MIVLLDFSDLFYRTMYNKKVLNKILKYSSFKVAPIIFLERVLGILKWVSNAEYLIVCQESYSWRKERLKSYKKSRTSVHQVLKEKVVENLKEIGLPSEDIEKEFEKLWSIGQDLLTESKVMMAKCSGYEADDLMALFSQYVDNNIIIFGADSDLWQLVSKRVKILRMVPRKRAHIVDMSNIKYFIHDFFFRGYPLLDWTPQHLPFLKLAFGDKADEVPPLILGSSTMFWYDFFKKNLNELVFLVQDPITFRSLLSQYIQINKLDYEVPSEEEVKRRFYILSLYKEVLRANNPQGFEEFKKLLEELKKWPKADLKLLSTKLMELKYELSFLRKR